jgi:hypothetical protein
VIEESGPIVKTPFTFLSFDGYGLPAEADEEEEYSSGEAGGARVKRVKALLFVRYFRRSISRRIGQGCRMASNPSICWHRASSFVKGNWGGQSERYSTDGGGSW